MIRRRRNLPRPNVPLSGPLFAPKRSAGAGRGRSHERPPKTCSISSYAHPDPSIVCISRSLGFPKQCTRIQTVLFASLLCAWASRWHESGFCMPRHARACGCPSFRAPFWTHYALREGRASNADAREVYGALRSIAGSSAHAVTFVARAEANAERFRRIWETNFGNYI